jgi:hypothetical protein
MATLQVCGRWLNNRAENSHQPFRRREGAMAHFRDIKTLQKFASVHASVHNHFNLERHLIPTVRNSDSGGFPFSRRCDSRLAKEIRHVRTHSSSNRLRQ